MVSWGSTASDLYQGKKGFLCERVTRCFVEKFSRKFKIINDSLLSMQVVMMALVFDPSASRFHLNLY